MKKTTGILNTESFSLILVDTFMGVIAVCKFIFDDLFYL